MIRELAQLMLAGWMAAVLTVSPLLAALECRQCCSAAGARTTVQASHADSADQSTPLCCHAKVPAKAEEPGRCDHCPKCELKRPLTAVVSSSFDWKLPTDFLTAILPPPADAVAVLSGIVRTAREEFVDLGTPPLRILFCVWRE